MPYVLDTLVLFITVTCLLQLPSTAEPLFGKEVRPVLKNEHSFIAYISIKGKTPNHIYRCSGALITKSHVLTVATCLNQQLWQDAKVFVGISDPGSPGIRRYRVKSAITLKEWVALYNLDANSLPSSDIGIVELEKEVLDIPPAVISSQAVFDSGIKVTVTGWGMTKDGTKTDPDPRRPQLVSSSELLNREDCEKRIVKAFSPEFRFRMPPEYLCSPGSKHRVSALPGDFGGPVLYNSGTMMGIIYGICPGSEPGHLVRGQVNIVLRIYDYIPFISNVTDFQISLN